MRIILALVTMAMVLGLTTSCGSSNENATLKGEVSSARARGIPGSTCGGLTATARQVQYFEHALAGAREGALRRLWGGRFGWFSVTDWPTSSDNSFVSYRPAKAIAFVRRSDGLRIDLSELAVSAPRQGGYVDVSYVGHIGGPMGVAEGERIVLLGKGAMNCDGTIRVWSMATKESQAEAFSACGTAPDRHVGKLAVCRMS